MHAAEMSLEENYNLSKLPASALNDLYDRTFEELRKCSKLLPGNEVNDEHGDEKEFSLLEFEASVLNQVSRHPLHNAEDISELMDIWAKASGVNDARDISVSDKIVMNIFRHLSGKLA